MGTQFIFIPHPRLKWAILRPGIYCVYSCNPTYKHVLKRGKKTIRRFKDAVRLGRSSHGEEKVESNEAASDKGGGS